MTRTKSAMFGFVVSLACSSSGFAQTHLPDVNARNLTVQNSPTFTACTGLMVGAGASPSSCLVPSYFATGTDASHLTGTVPAARMPAFVGGDCTTTAGSVALSCQFQSIGTGALLYSAYTRLYAMSSEITDFCTPAQIATDMTSCAQAAINAEIGRAHV